MKRKHYLLDLFNGVEDRFVVEAVKSREPARPVVRKNRIVLIAALVALTALLAGCVAVFLRLQDMSVGQSTFTQHYDDEGKRIEPTEKTVELFTFFGHGGSPAQLAAKEWLEFTQTYTRPDVGNDPNLPGIPDQYEYNYDCVTQEMVDKVDELAEKYNLKLLETRFGIQPQQEDIALEALGISSLFRDGAKVEAEPVAGMIYPPSNFRFYVNYTLTGENAQWKTPVYGMMFYSRKDFFPLPFYQSFEQDKIQQWNYTAADGTKLLLALRDDGNGYIVADLPDAIIGIQLALSGSGSLAEDAPAPTKAALEQLADVIDYKIQPNVADPDALQAKLDASNAALFGEDDEEVPTYASFDDYFMEKAAKLQRMDYCVYDLNGDGKDDILFTQPGDGRIHTVLTPLADGTILEYEPWPMRLLENGYLSDYDDHTLTDRKQFYIMRTYSDTCAIFLKDNGVSIQTGDTIWRIRWEDDSWQRVTLKPNQYVDELAPMTEAEVQAILEEYPPMEMAWKPAAQYKLSSGQTLAELLQSMDVILSDE